MNPRLKILEPFISKYSVNKTINIPETFTVTTDATASKKLFFKLLIALVDFIILWIASNEKCPSLIKTFKSKLTLGNTRKEKINHIKKSFKISPGILIVPSCNFDFNFPIELSPFKIA